MCISSGMFDRLRAGTVSNDGADLACETLAPTDRDGLSGPAAARIAGARGAECTRYRSRRARVFDEMAFD
jgi:hypothetical protein